MRKSVHFVGYSHVSALEHFTNFILKNLSCVFQSSSLL